MNVKVLIINISALSLIHTSSIHAIHNNIIMVRYKGRAVVSNHNNIVLDIGKTAGMDETYGTYVDDERFYIHDS